MKLNQFRNVIAIAERGSLRGASRLLGLAQPALTRSIHELERELGAPLFERRARGMILTPTGEVFVRRATAVLGEVRRAREEIDQLHGGTGGSVVAGLSMVPHVALLPKALRPFRERYPQVRLHVIEGSYLTVEAQLRDGSIDFYIGPQPGRALSGDLLQEKLFDNTRMVLARHGHPLAKARSLRDLADAEWVTNSITMKDEEELGELFAKHGLDAPKLGMRCQSALTLMVALAYSDLLAMVPTQLTNFELTAGALTPIAIKEILPAPAIVVVRRAGLPLTPAAQLLLDLISRAIPSARRVKSKGRAG